MSNADATPTALLPPALAANPVTQLVGGRYRILRELGSGGMGTVFEAEDTHQGSKVALKIMTPSGGWEGVVRFHREARIAASASTRHVVQVFEAGSDQATERHFIAMELLEGEDMSELVRRLGPVPEHLALRMVIQACAGLSCAHRDGVIHRDIKPANLYITRDEGQVVVKVLDFGAAKAPEPFGPKLTDPGTLIGSPHYMAPEQARGKPVDVRADVWSLGVVLYKLLCGRAPFHDSPSFTKLLYRLFTEAVPSLRERAPWVRPQVAEVVHRALSREATGRHASVDELAYALLPLAGGSAVIRDDELSSPQASAGETLPCFPSKSGAPGYAYATASTQPPPF